MRLASRKRCLLHQNHLFPSSSDFLLRYYFPLLATSTEGLQQLAIKDSYMYTYTCKPVPKYVYINNIQSIMWKAMATHSSTLAWKIPGMEEPGRLQSMESHRVGHD